MSDNILERAIVPYNPSSNRVVNNNQYNLYAPAAGIGKVGMAGYSQTDFDVSNSQTVSISNTFKGSVLQQVKIDDIPSNITYEGTDGIKTTGVMYNGYTREVVDVMMADNVPVYITVTGALLVALSDFTDADNYSVTEMFIADGRTWTRELDIIDGEVDEVTDFMPLGVGDADKLKLDNVAQAVSEFYVKTDIAVANTRNGKLSANGRCIADENYRTRRYTVAAGDIIYLKAAKESDGVFQFQRTNSLPGGVGSDNADVVGYTAEFAWDGMIKVPEGAINVYVSSLASNTTNKVCSTASYIDSLNFSTSATIEKVSDLGIGSGYGYLSTGGVPTPSSTIQQAYYDLLHVVKGTTIYTVGGTHTLIGVMAYLYDENMTYVSTVGSYSPATKSIVIPSDGYVRILTKISDVNTAEGIEDEIAEQIKIIMPIFPAVDNARYSAFTSWQTEFESGGIDKNSEYASSNQARSVGKIACGKGTIIKLPDTAWRFDIIRYDLFSGTYLNRTDGIKQSYVLDGDYFIRIIVRKYPSNTISAADITALPSKIKCVVLPCSQLSQALISGSKTLPSYYFTDSYIDNRVSEIMAHDSDTGYDGDAFFFITDTHWQNINNKRSPALMDYIKRKTGINKIHFAGDAVSNSSSSSYPKSEMKEMITANRDAFSFADRWYGLCGNHDANAFGNASGNLSDAECYAYIVRENENRITVIDEFTYYYDNERLKIRYLFVGCTSGATIKSVPNVLQAIAAVPDNYSLLVLSHIGLDENQSIISAFQDIVNALDAAQSQTAYTLDGTTYAFHNINVIGVLSGHNHCDGVYTTSGGTNIISTTTDSWDESGGLTRTRSTVNEQAFDVVQIDKANSTVYLTRIGAGTDRVIHYVSNFTGSGDTEDSTTTIYGVSGLYGSTPALTRTDDAIGMSFSINSSTGAIASDFNDVFPWTDAEVVEDALGNKFVEMPDMWFRIGRDASNNITDIAVSKQEGATGDWYKVDSFRYSCYGGSKASSALQSVTGATRLHTQTRAQFRTAAAANGSGYFQEDLYHKNVMMFLWWIEWATKDSASIMTGRIANSGTSGGSSIRPTGGTDNVTTPSGFETAYAQMRYHYIEDFVGNLFEFVDGSVGTDSSGGVQYVTDDSTKFSDTTTNMNASFNSPTTSGNCIAAFGWDVNNPFLCLPKVTVSNSSYNTYFCDYGATTNNIMLFCGAFWYRSGANFGLSYFGRDTASSSSNVIGGRLLYKSAS